MKTSPWFQKDASRVENSSVRLSLYQYFEETSIIEGTRKLADKVFATHIKDLKPVKGLNATEWYFFSSTPVGDGLVDNQKIAQLLYDANYQGFLAVETDSLHPDYENQEHEAIATSVRNLKKIASLVE